MHASGLVEWRAPHELYLPPSVDRYPEGPHTIDMDVTLRVGLSVALWQAGDSQSAIRELFDACDQDDRGEVSPTHAFEIAARIVAAAKGLSPVEARAEEQLAASACAAVADALGSAAPGGGGGGGGLSFLAFARLCASPHARRPAGMDAASAASGGGRGGGGGGLATFNTPLLVPTKWLLRGHAAPVVAIRELSQSMLVATAAADGSVRLWDPTAKQHRLTLAHALPTVRLAPGHYARLPPEVTGLYLAA